MPNFYKIKVKLSQFGDENVELMATTAGDEDKLTKSIMKQMGEIEIFWNDKIEKIVIIKE